MDSEIGDGNLGVVGWVVVIVLALMVGVGGLLWGLAYRQMGLEASPNFAIRWFLHPMILTGLALGILARVLAYAALKFVNVSQITLLSALGIVATLVLAWLVLGERLSPKEWVGAAMIVIGAALIGR